VQAQASGDQGLYQDAPRTGLVTLGAVEPAGVEQPGDGAPVLAGGSSDLGDVRHRASGH